LRWVGGWVNSDVEFEVSRGDNEATEDTRQEIELRRRSLEV
jgi:hypothetical protein